MSDGQTDLAVFKDIAGEVRGSLGQATHGNIRTDRKV